MMEERYHATTQNRFYPHMSNVNKNITVKTKLISPPMYICIYIYIKSNEEKYVITVPLCSEGHLFTSNECQEMFVKFGLLVRTFQNSSSYICHGVGPLVDPFRSHVSRSLLKGLG